MFHKKARLSRVRIIFLEGGCHSATPVPIEIVLGEGETFHTVNFGDYEVRRPDNQRKRYIDPVAGFTTDVEFFYV